MTRISRLLVALRFEVLLAVALACASAPISAQSSDPSTLPRVTAADLRYLGSFAVPADDGQGASLTYGGQALGMGANGDTLLIGCHDWNQRLAEITIPPIGGTAQIVQPCRETNLRGAFEGTPKIGGSLVWQGRTLISGYVYYDANWTATVSHAVLGSGTWTRVGNDPPAFVAGYMGVVPQEWRVALGGPALTGQCCLSIISRTSSGPALSVFDPADLIGIQNSEAGTKNPIPATQVLGYPLAHELSGSFDGRPLFNLATTIGGVAFPSGTRSVLFIGKIGLGEYCYGTGGASGGSAPGTCYDPVFSAKGEHMYPYIHQVWAYDATDLVKVKNGELAPWDVKPYATWRLTEMNDSNSASMRPGGMTFDPATRRIFVTEGYSEEPRVHVYQVTSGSSDPPPPSEPPTNPEPPATDAVLEQLRAIRAALETLSAGAPCTVTGEGAYANGDRRLTVRCPAGAAAKGDAVTIRKR